MPDSEPLAFIGLLDPTNVYYDSSIFGWICGGEELYSKDIVNEMVDGEEWTVRLVLVSTLLIEAQIPTKNGFRNVSWSSWYL